MKVDNVGILVEHSDGRLDLEYWIIDAEYESFVELVINHREELIKLAKEAGTYTFSLE